MFINVAFGFIVVKNSSSIISVFDGFCVYVMYIMFVVCNSVCNLFWLFVLYIVCNGILY